MVENKKIKELINNESGTRSKDFLKLFKKGVQFTEELLEENERLRTRLVRLEEENRLLAQKTMGSTAYSELLEQMESLEEERKGLLDRFQRVEEESAEFKERYKEIEEENNRLANLYIASYQLHSALDVKEVVKSTFEIIINLVGSMDFALYIVDNANLVPISAQGRPLTALSVIKIGEGIAGKTAGDRQVYVSNGEMSKVSIDEPKVCVPLEVDEQLLGMIVVFSFLDQKSSITELDRELFKLLGGHAASALYCALLKAESKEVLHDASNYLKLLSK